MHLSRKTCHIFHLHYQGKTCQGELASVYDRQVFLDKSTCQGKLSSVNEALGPENIIRTVNMFVSPCGPSAKFTIRTFKIYHVDENVT